MIPLVLIDLIAGWPGNGVLPSIDDSREAHGHARLSAQYLAQRIQYLIDFITIIVMHGADANGTPAIVDAE